MLREYVRLMQQEFLLEREKEGLDRRGIMLEQTKRD